MAKLIFCELGEIGSCGAGLTDSEYEEATYEKGERRNEIIKQDLSLVGFRNYEQEKVKYNGKEYNVFDLEYSDGEVIRVPVTDTRLARVKNILDKAKTSHKLRVAKDIVVNCF